MLSWISERKRFKRHDKKFPGFRGLFSKFLRWNKLRSRLEKSSPFTREENWTSGTQGGQKDITVKKGRRSVEKLSGRQFLSAVYARTFRLKTNEGHWTENKIAISFYRIPVACKCILSYFQLLLSLPLPPFCLFFTSLKTLYPDPLTLYLGRHFE